MSEQVQVTETAAPEGKVGGLPSVEEIAKGILEKQPAAEPVEAKAEEVVEAVEKPVEKKAEEDKFSSKFAALSRRERELKKKEAEFEAQMKQMKDEVASLKSVKDAFENLKKTPVKSLKEMGVSYENVTQDLLGNYKEAPADPTEQRFKTLEQRLAEADAKAAEASNQLTKYQEEQRSQQVQQAENTIRYNLRETISENADKFELCGKMGDEAIELSRHIMQEYYDRHGKVLSYDEILDITEKHYTEAVLKKLLTAKKAKELAGFKAPETKTQSAPKKGQSATLTNAQKGSQDPVNLDKLPKEDALKYLIQKHLNK